LLDQLAMLAAARGRHEEAALALGRADVHHCHRHGRRERYLRGPNARAMAAAAIALDADRLARTLARGAAMGDHEVALRLVSEPPADGPSP
ncbi:MAG: hypothetical protein HY020_15075, partial [Burkholderiales bacterium]|nr:hypothetical protein [Burkholderiales bacterium]